MKEKLTNGMWEGKDSERRGIIMMTTGLALICGGLAVHDQEVAQRQPDEVGTSQVVYLDEPSQEVFNQDSLPDRLAGYAIGAGMLLGVGGMLYAGKDHPGITPWDTPDDRRRY